MIHIGKLEEVGVAIEASRGVAESAPSKWLKKVSASIVSKVEKTLDDSNQGVMEDSVGARVTKKWFEGDLEGIIHADALGYLLMNVYGADTPTSLGSGVYSHAFSLEQSVEHPSLSIFRKDDSATQKVYSGGVISKLTISAKPEDYVRFSASIVCGGEGSDANNASYDTEYDFIGKDVTIKIADTEAGLAGATALDVKDLSLAYDLGAIQDFKLGSYGPSNYNAKSSIEVDLTKNFEDATFEDLLKADTAKYMKIEITGDTAIATGIYPKITLILNKAMITDWSKDAPADGLATEKLKFKAFYNATDGEQSTLTLINKTASYVAAS